jgi:hypothetical protein
LPAEESFLTFTRLLSSNLQRKPSDRLFGPTVRCDPYISSLISNLIHIRRTSLYQSSLIYFKINVTGAKNGGRGSISDDFPLKMGLRGKYGPVEAL